MPLDEAIDAGMTCTGVAPLTLAAAETMGTKAVHTGLTVAVAVQQGNAAAVLGTARHHSTDSAKCRHFVTLAIYLYCYYSIIILCTMHSCAQGQHLIIHYI